MNNNTEQCVVRTGATTADLEEKLADGWHVVSSSILNGGINNCQVEYILQREKAQTPVSDAPVERTRAESGDPAITEDYEQ